MLFAMTQPPNPGGSGVESVPVFFCCYGCGQGVLSGAIAELKRGRPGGTVEIGVDGRSQPAE